MNRKYLAAFAAGTLLTLTTWFLFAPGGLHRCWLTARSSLAILRDEPARLSIVKKTVNFETVTAGPVVRGHFAVKNQGGKRLLLVREGSSCECVDGDSQLTVGPGQVRELMLAIDTRKTSGAVNMTVRYQTNDPRCPILVLAMLGTVVEDVAAQMKSGTLRPIPSVEYSPQS
jgi:hypothetical protein